MPGNQPVLVDVRFPQCQASGFTMRRCQSFMNPTFPMVRVNLDGLDAVFGVMQPPSGAEAAPVGSPSNRCRKADRARSRSESGVKGSGRGIGCKGSAAGDASAGAHGGPGPLIV